MRARKARGSEKPKQKVVTVPMKDLDDILARVRATGLPEKDCETIAALIDTVSWLREELDRNALTVARLRSLFGLKTSEKTKDILGDGDQPDEDPKTGPDRNGPPGRSEEPEKDESKGKKKGHGRRAASEYTGAERIQVSHDSLSPGALCPLCPPQKPGRLYLLSQPRTLVRVTGQAPLKATVYELQTLRCNLCGTVFPAEPPPGVGEEKYDATAASMIALLKYGSGLPFNRLERLEGHLGIPLPAATQWEIVEEASREVTPVYSELIRQAAQGRLLHNDDTSIEILELRKEIDRQEKSGETDRTGTFSSSIVSECEDGRRIALFFTGRNHAGENLEKLLRQRACELDPPMQMCDGLSRNLPKDFETVLGNCLAHGRRKFVELIGSFPEECRYVILTLRDVYRNDATAKEQGLSTEERLLYHQAHSRPLMDALQLWMKEQIDEKRVEPNSSLGGAIAYMQKRWDKLTLFLRKPGAPLDNNIAERALKMVILHRKNSLFYKTANGARVGDTFMSLIHTAELARPPVNPLDYLVALLDHAADVRSRPDRWLPWNYASTLAEKSATTTVTP